MSHNIFIAGCGRSGTTLLQRLMRNFSDTHVHLKESPSSVFREMPEGYRAYCVKRNGIAFKELPSLEDSISLIYMVRHPFDTLTSYHPGSPKRKYYIRPRRWLGEHGALLALEAAQPKRSIHFVRYEDLVTSPDGVQSDISEALGLEAGRLFSEAEEIRPAVERWRKDRDKRAYLSSLDDVVRANLMAFCVRFGYRSKV